MLKLEQMTRTSLKYSIAIFATFVGGIFAFSVLAATPAAPSNLTAGVISSSQISISWTDNSNDESNFLVYRSINPDLSDATIVLVSADVASYLDTGLSPATTYYYQVYACNTDGCASSNVLSATTTAGSGPARPTNLQATPVSACAINLQWDQTGPGAYYFNLGRSKNNFLDSSEVFRRPFSGDLPGVPPPFVGSENLISAGEGLFSATDYWHRIESCDNSAQNACSGEVDFNEAKTFSLPSVPGNPVIVKISSDASLDGTTQDIEIRWATTTEIPIFSGFSIFRSENGGPFEFVDYSPLYTENLDNIRRPIPIDPGTQRLLMARDLFLNANSYYTYRVYVYASDFRCKVEPGQIDGPTALPNNNNQAVFSGSTSDSLVPIRPTNLAGSYNNVTRVVSLSWDDNSDVPANELIFRVVKSTDPNFSEAVPGVTTEFDLPPNTTTTDGGSTVSDTTYYYKVHACSADNVCSASSDVLSISTGLANPELNAMIYYATGTVGNVYVFWRGIAKAESITLHRSTVADFGTYMPIIVVGSIYRDKDIPLGGTYYYRLEATGGGLTVYSNTIALNMDLKYVLSGVGWASAGPVGVGWVKFNSASEGGLPPSAEEYSVNIDSDGFVSGAAWADDYGWLSFGSFHLSGCPLGNCEPEIDLASTGLFSGWARFLAPRLRPNLGSWDGWLHLSGLNYGSQMNLTTPFALSGAVWGNDVLGWLAFGAPECADCTVRATLLGVVTADNNPPVASNVQVQFGPEGWAAETPYYDVTWDYDDADGDPQQEAELEFYKVSDGTVSRSVPWGADAFYHFSDPLGWYENGSYNGPNYLNTGTDYRVRVKVYDGIDWSLAWDDSSTFTTPAYYLPFVKIGQSPEPAQTITLTQFTNESVDRSDGQDPITGLFWTFENADISQSSEPNESVVFNGFPSIVTLTIYYNDGISSVMLEKTVTGSDDLPPLKRRIIIEQ